MEYIHPYTEKRKYDISKPDQYEQMMAVFESDKVFDQKSNEYRDEFYLRFNDQEIMEIFGQLGFFNLDKMQKTRAKRLVAFQAASIIQFKKNENLSPMNRQHLQVEILDILRKHNVFISTRNVSKIKPEDMIKILQYELRFNLCSFVDDYFLSLDHIIRYEMLEITAENIGRGSIDAQIFKSKINRRKQDEFNQRCRVFCAMNSTLVDFIHQLQN